VQYLSLMKSDAAARLRKRVQPRNQPQNIAQGDPVPGGTAQEGTGLGSSAQRGVVSSAPAQGRRSQANRAPILIAIALGLGSGLLLAAPLAELLNGKPPSAGAHLSNPFTGWIGIGNQDILVLGTDVGGGNTDVITWLRVEDGITHLTQIPRDSYIDSEGYGPQKINALYALGGIDLIKRELSRKLGRPINHHVVVNLAAIRQMADALGGIEVNVPKRLYYVDNSQGLFIDLQPGMQNLKGRDLEGFLRFRHDEMGDIGRLERQQLALKALFRKLTRPDQLVRLPILLTSAGHNLKTDLGPMELGGLLTAMGTTSLDTKRLGGRPFSRNGLSYWDADWPARRSTDESNEGNDRYRFLF
jgi:LCP family protein required for cell wall assembly